MAVYTLDTRTATPHFPGIGRYVTSLAAHLPAHLADDESLILLTPNNVSLTQLHRTRHPLQVTAVHAEASPFSLSQQWSMPRLLRRVRAARGSALVYHSPYYLMPYAVPYPTALTLYDTIALTLPETVSARARMLFRLTTSLALRVSRRVITISRAARNDLLAQFNLDPATVITIPLAADDSFRPRSLAEQWRLRTAFNLSGDYLLYVGSNKPHKNLVRLIDAYALLRHETFTDRLTPPRLVIAGAWDDRYPEARHRAEHHGLGDAVRFLGPVDNANLPVLYSAALAFVFPSRYEGFGLPVLEAMACGAPIACSRASSLPEVAADAATYFDPDHVASIANALYALITDQPLRRRLRELGLVRAKTFSWSDTAAATLDVYRGLAYRK